MKELKSLSRARLFAAPWTAACQASLSINNTQTLLKSIESVIPSNHPLNCKEIQPVHPKGNQSWIFIGSTNAEAEASILWPIDPWKNTDAGRD